MKASKTFHLKPLLKTMLDNCNMSEVIFDDILVIHIKKKNNPPSERSVHKHEMIMYVIDKLVTNKSSSKNIMELLKP